MSQYLQEFKSRQDVADNYGGDRYNDEKGEQSKAILNELRGSTIHLAWYGYGSYCGSSLVIYEKDGKLYEVNGSHCSCYGLEGQWKPEETSWEALKERDITGEYDGSAEAQALLQRLVKRNLKKMEEK